MTVQGQLPTISDNWIDDLPQIEPRLIGKYMSTVYSHAFIIQPKRHNNTSGTYSSLILEDEDHKFALKQIPRYIQSNDSLKKYFDISPKANTNDKSTTRALQGANHLPKYSEISSKLLILCKN